MRMKLLDALLLKTETWYCSRMYCMSGCYHRKHGVVPNVQAARHTMSIIRIVCTLQLFTGECTDGTCIVWGEGIVYSVNIGLEELYASTTCFTETNCVLALRGYEKQVVTQGILLLGVRSVLKFYITFHLDIMVLKSILCRIKYFLRPQVIFLVGPKVK